MTEFSNWIQELSKSNFHERVGRNFQCASGCYCVCATDIHGRCNVKSLCEIVKDWQGCGNSNQIFITKIPLNCCWLYVTSKNRVNVHIRSSRSCVYFSTSIFSFPLSSLCLRVPLRATTTTFYPALGHFVPMNIILTTNQVWHGRIWVMKDNIHQSHSGMPHAPFNIVRQNLFTVPFQVSFVSTR